MFVNKHIGVLCVYSQTRPGNSHDGSPMIGLPSWSPVQHLVYPRCAPRPSPRGRGTSHMKGKGPCARGHPPRVDIPGHPPAEGPARGTARSIREWVPVLWGWRLIRWAGRLPEQQTEQQQQQRQRGAAKVREASAGAGALGLAIDSLGGPRSSRRQQQQQRGRGCGETRRGSSPAKRAPRGVAPRVFGEERAEFPGVDARRRISRFQGSTPGEGFTRRHGRKPSRGPSHAIFPTSRRAASSTALRRFMDGSQLHSSSSASLSSRRRGEDSARGLGLARPGYCGRCSSGRAGKLP